MLLLGMEEEGAGDSALGSWLCGGSAGGAAGAEAATSAGFRAA